MVTDKADSIFSLYIRTRDRWTCQRCGNYDPPTTDSKSHMQNSHYFGRGMESVRFDEENCDCLCHGCHRYWEKENREAYRDFKIKQLGERGYNMLLIRANTTQKKDREAAYLYWKARYNELVKSRNTNVIGGRYGTKK